MQFEVWVSYNFVYLWELLTKIFFTILYNLLSWKIKKNILMGVIKVRTLIILSS